MKFFTVLFFLPSLVLAAETAEVFSSGAKVVCNTPDLVIHMKPRAPKIGENVVIERIGSTVIVQAKVEVTLVNKSTRKTLDRLTVEDATDPWESANPIYQGKTFSFATDADGKPFHLVHNGKDLSSSAICKLSNR